MLVRFRGHGPGIDPEFEVLDRALAVPAAARHAECDGARGDETDGDRRRGDRVGRTGPRETFSRGACNRERHRPDTSGASVAYRDRDRAGDIGRNRHVEAEAAGSAGRARADRSFR